MYISPEANYLFDLVYEDGTTVLPDTSPEDVKIMRELNEGWMRLNPRRSPLFDFTRVEGKGLEDPNTGTAAVLPQNETLKKTLLESLKTKFGNRVVVENNIALVLDTAPLAVRPSPELAELSIEHGVVFDWTINLIFSGTEKEKRLANFVLSRPTSFIKRKREKGFYAVARKTAVATFWCTIHGDPIHGVHPELTASFACVK